MSRTIRTLAIVAALAVAVVGTATVTAPKADAQVIAVDYGYPTYWGGWGYTYPSGYYAAPVSTWGGDWYTRGHWTHGYTNSHGTYTRGHYTSGHWNHHHR